MPVLPVPMIIALLLFGFLLRRLLTRETHLTLALLIGCCAVQSALVAVVQYYGVAWLRPVLPVFATVIPAVAWFAFQHALMGHLRLQDMFWHGAGPLFAVLCLMTYPNGLDLLIPVVFAAYGLAILIALSRGEDSLPHSRLENGGMSLVVWRVLAVALLGSAVTDVVIAMRLAAGDGDTLRWLPSLFSSATLLLLGVLSFSHSIESESTEDVETYSEQEATRDDSIIAKLDAYIENTKPYLDPDLTLARLARKLLVPEKQLSSAINKRKGENVSRYINGYRIRHACGLMQQGQSVTEAMLASGFNTKSNFNREFLRVQGCSPRLWLKSNACDA